MKASSSKVRFCQPFRFLHASNRVASVIGDLPLRVSAAEDVDETERRELQAVFAVKEDATRRRKAHPPKGKRAERRLSEGRKGESANAGADLYP